MAVVNMKKIVIIGSAGSLLVNFRFSFMKELIAQGYEVHAIASDDAGVDQRLSQEGVIFHPLPINRHSLSITDSVRYFFQLRGILKAIKPAICLAYTIKPVIFGMIASRVLGIKYRYSLITGLGYAFIARGVKAKLIFSAARFLYRLAFSFSKKVIFQNNDDREYCCQLRLLEKSKAEVVNGSGVDLSYFLPTSFPEQLTFLMVARFLPEKGIFEYVDACIKLKKLYPNVRCCLVGYIDNLSAGISETDIQSWQTMGIEYLGKQEDVRLALSDASVYVLPSYREGTPRSTLEAMAMGRPIITTDTPGCRETVVDGVNGFLVLVKNSDALYEAMLRFIHAPSLIAKMGQESLQIVREKFDVNKVNQDMMRIMGL